LFRILQGNTKRAHGAMAQYNGSVRACIFLHHFHARMANSGQGQIMNFRAEPQSSYSGLLVFFNSTCATGPRTPLLQVLSISETTGRILRPPYRIAGPRILFYICPVVICIILPDHRIDPMG